ncbi:MAG: hypothetical protein KAH54_01365 [Candidatus Sabulitectum sp.]|nr:hypothetical protein [Candidatus Sabulitectum sp.]
MRNTKKFKFAIASSDGVSLTTKHFGDSESFVLGEVAEDGTSSITTHIRNEFKNVDETTAHGSTEKRRSILSYLGEDIDFIIAGQMSPNFKKINTNTMVCPIVSEIIDIELLLTHLKDNFHLLKEKQEAKAEKRETSILKISKRTAI